MEFRSPTELGKDRLETTIDRPLGIIARTSCCRRATLTSLIGGDDCRHPVCRRRFRVPSQNSCFELAATWVRLRCRIQKKRENTHTHTTPHHTTTQHNTTQHNTPHHTTPQHNTTQHNTTHTTHTHTLHTHTICILLSLSLSLLHFPSLFSTFPYIYNKNPWRISAHWPGQDILSVLCLFLRSVTKIITIQTRKFPGRIRNAIVSAFFANFMPLACNLMVFHKKYYNSGESIRVWIRRCNCNCNLPKVSESYWFPKTKQVTCNCFDSKSREARMGLKTGKIKGVNSRQHNKAGKTVKRQSTLMRRFLAKTKGLLMVVSKRRFESI